ncbi:DUF881 domain-containing protein [Candidatus Peregrinibacteria bacterium]|nr:DUF881 domain-containing protein [Candidatus Peregrinibacteria bacterium]
MVIVFLSIIILQMRKNAVATILLSVIILGLVLAWSIYGKNTGDILSSDELETREELIKTFLDEQAYLQSRIVFLRKQIDESQKELDMQTASVSLDILEKLKKDIGLVEASGKGVEILLNDGNSPNQPEALVQAADIRDIVNILNAASAEAISVNGQRIIASSAVAAVGTTILVNNSHLAAPFIITAIGDQDVILQRLLSRELLPDIYARMNKNGLTFKIKKSNSIVAPIYNGDLRTDYLNLVQK